MEVRINIQVKNAEFSRLKHLMTDSNSVPLPENCPKDAMGFIEIQGVNETITIGCYEE